MPASRHSPRPIVSAAASDRRRAGASRVCRRPVRVPAARCPAPRPAAGGWATRCGDEMRGCVPLEAPGAGGVRAQGSARHAARDGGRARSTQPPSTIPPYVAHRARRGPRTGAARSPGAAGARVVLGSRVKPVRKQRPCCDAVALSQTARLAAFSVRTKNCNCALPNATKPAGLGSF